MGNLLQERIAIDKYIMALPFQFTDVLDAAGTMVSVQVTTLAYNMPWAGSIIAIAANSNAAFSTGTVTFRPTINTTASTALTCALSSTAQYASATKPANHAASLVFAANARIGMDFTKSGTVDPVTNDISGTIWVVLYPVEL